MRFVCFFNCLCCFSAGFLLLDIALAARIGNVLLHGFSWDLPGFQVVFPEKILYRTGLYLNKKWAGQKKGRLYVCETCLYL